MHYTLSVNQKKKNIQEHINDKDVYVLREFLSLSGFSQYQLDKTSKSYIVGGRHYIKLSEIVGIVSENACCEFDSFPSNLDIESKTLGTAIHNVNGRITRKICSGVNLERKAQVIQKFKNPFWYDVTKLIGHFLHIKTTCQNHTNTWITERVENITLHIELRSMDVMDQSNK